MAAQRRRPSVSNRLDTLALFGGEDRRRCGLIALREMLTTST